MNSKKICFVKTKNRNDSISIGASVVIKELQNNYLNVDIVSFAEALKFDIVLISMTATIDLFDIYKNLKKYRFDKRGNTKVIIGGFGVQNVFLFKDFVDYAFFGRADNIIAKIIQQIIDNKSFEYPFLWDFSDKKIQLRQVSALYKGTVLYGKNNTKWSEKFVGCAFRCKFCHYSHNRKYINKHKTYINDGLSAGSPEIMVKDMHNIDKKLGRFTTALDGYSERLRYKYGKRISWQMLEEGLDNVLQFKGSTFIKLYNIHNFPTELQSDRNEFFEFFKNYVENTSKYNGSLTIEILNTAFRPSINTPMERMPAKLHPEARYENTLIAKGEGIIVKFSNFNQDAYSHLLDLISIRYTQKDFDLIDFIVFDKDFNKKNNKDKLLYIVENYNITSFTKEYKASEPFISDIFM